MEVIAAEPTIARCDIFRATSSTVAVTCITITDYISLIGNIKHDKLSPPSSTSKYNIYDSATIRHNVSIFGIDIHFINTFLLTTTKYISTILRYVWQLVSISKSVKNLQCMLLVFPIDTATDDAVDGFSDFFISYFPDWRISLSRISCATFRDPIAAYCLVIWGVHR